MGHRLHSVVYAELFYSCDSWDRRAPVQGLQQNAGSKRFSFLLDGCDQVSKGRPYEAKKPNLRLRSTGLIFV